MVTGEPYLGKGAEEEEEAGRVVSLCFYRVNYAALTLQ